MKIKVAEATPAQLNWLAATIEGLEFDEDDQPIWFERDGFAEPRSTYEPATDRAQGWAILDAIKGFSFKHWLECKPTSCCEALINNYEGNWIAFGPTPLIAGLRCWVAYKMGDEVEIPEGLA